MFSRNAMEELIPTLPVTHDPDMKLEDTSPVIQQLASVLMAQRTETAIAESQAWMPPAGMDPLEFKWHGPAGRDGMVSESSETQRVEEEQRRTRAVEAHVAPLVRSERKVEMTAFPQASTLQRMSDELNADANDMAVSDLRKLLVATVTMLGFSLSKPIEEMTRMELHQSVAGLTDHLETSEVVLTKAKSEKPTLEARAVKVDPAEERITKVKLQALLVALIGLFALKPAKPIEGMSDDELAEAVDCMTDYVGSPDIQVSDRTTLAHADGYHALNALRRLVGIFTAVPVVERAAPPAQVAGHYANLALVQRAYDIMDFCADGKVVIEKEAPEEVVKTVYLIEQLHPADAATDWASRYAYHSTTESVEVVTEFLGIPFDPAMAFLDARHPYATGLKYRVSMLSPEQLNQPAMQILPRINEVPLEMRPKWILFEVVVEGCLPDACYQPIAYTYNLIALDQYVRDAGDTEVTYVDGKKENRMKFRGSAAGANFDTYGLPEKFDRPF